MPFFSRGRIFYFQYAHFCHRIEVQGITLFILGNVVFILITVQRAHARG